MKKLILFTSMFLLAIFLISCDVSINTQQTHISEPIISQPIETPVITQEISDPVVEITYQEQLILNLEKWGLGEEIITYVTLDRPYTWYVNQYDTGLHRSSNCGPSSIEMAGRFVNQDFHYTAGQIRSSYRPNGGWWYDSDIFSALWQFKIPNKVSYVTQVSDLISIIDQGHIALINNNMSIIPQNLVLTERTNRFYSNVTGHYLIVKGYIVTDRNTFFEVYDPYSNLFVNSDDQKPKGMNRYYVAHDLIASINDWYTKVYEIIPSSD